METATKAGLKKHYKAYLKKAKEVTVVTAVSTVHVDIEPGAKLGIGIKVSPFSGEPACR